MAEVIKMPRMSDTMTEGVIVEWHKKVGDNVEPGEVMAEVETDKATMELESYQEGVLLHIGVEKGNAVPVDSIIAVIGEKGEDYKEVLANQEKAKPEVEEKKEAPAEKAAEPVANVVPSTLESKPVSNEQLSSNKNGRIKASPLAKKIAQDKGIDLANIQGSGDNGRIVKRDLENASVSSGTTLSGNTDIMSIQLPQVVGEESYEDVTVSQMRKTIAKRLAESKFSAPHFYLNMEVNMSKAIEARKSINEIAPVKISFNDLVVKASALALRQHPKVNAAWMEDKIRHNKHVHVGIAVAVEEGLLVPVIRFTDNKTLSQISVETKQFAEKAKNKKLQPSDWEGNTFTISNLGMFDIDEFTAIINPPDACILAVGKIKETPIVENGEMKIGNIMKLTLSCDHRVVDGATGAQFLQTLKSFLEDPVRLLV